MYFTDSNKFVATCEIKLSNEGNDDRDRIVRVHDKCKEKRKRKYSFYSFVSIIL